MCFFFIWFNRDDNGIILGDSWIYPLVMTMSLPWKMAIELVDLFMKHADVPYFSITYLAMAQNYGTNDPQISDHV